MSVLVIGLVPHKASNTIAVLDAEERLVTRPRIEDTADGLVAIARAAWFDRRIDDVNVKIHAAVKVLGTTVTRIYGVGGGQRWAHPRRGR